MPNHVHGIIFRGVDGGAETQNTCPVETRHANVETRHAASLPGPLKSGSLPVIVGSYKLATTKQIHRLCVGNNFVWQPRYYDCIIMGEESLHGISEYIINNPKNWEIDRNNKKDLHM
ncbi:MAG: hypothetical protein PHW53_04380 [Patescibacteria group bacterium]|nr:hypothetical protein [Patescibacteria group bacterium]